MGHVLVSVACFRSRRQSCEDCEQITFKATDDNDSEMMTVSALEGDESLK